MSEKLIGRVKNQVEIVITLWMLSFMNFKSVVNQMITPHNETCFLSDRFKKQQSQQKKCDFSANDSTTTPARSMMKHGPCLFISNSNQLEQASKLHCQPTIFKVLSG